jgi:TolB-like protein/Flp pilus assembly protein TadD
MSVEATPTPKAGATAQGRRLESWKEIAAYLGRDVTTVRRWEKGEGLPVHRHLHNKLGSVYAFTTELDAWRNNRAPAAATDAPDTPPPVPESVRLGRHGRMAAVLAAITLILAAGVIWLVRERTAKSTASLAIRSLAVLPLANFSGNSEQDYLSDGMTEALTAQLSTIRGLRVISRTSTMQLKGTRKSVPAIGKELNVDAVIEGSVLRSGDKVRVTVQLIRAATDEHLWAATYDRELRDILVLQSDVAQGIARHVEAAVAGAQNLAVAPRTVAPEVYEAYLKGRFALTKGNRASLDEALAFFAAAINADSAFAPAYVGVAATQEQLGTVFFGVPPGDSRPKVIEAARKALELDPQLAEARVLLANALQRDWHWEEAETEYRRAIELSPSDAGAYAGLAYWLVCQGRSDEALAWARRAQEMDPLTFNSIDVSGILFYSRRYEEAIRESRRNLTTNPNDPLALWSLGFALVGAEQFDDAIHTLEKAASLSDRSPAVLGVLARAYAHGGRRAEAVQVVDELQRRGRKDYVPAAAFLNAYLGLGDKEKAFVWLERAAQERSNIMQYLKVHPFFDLLRGDPRFADYLRRTNLRS